MATTSFKQLGRLFCQRVDQVADNQGFVALGQLAQHFGVDLVFRPLLVEALIASVNANDLESRNRWAVLLDSETFRFGQDEIQSEAAGRPLPSRLRNTVAHEIAHSVGFRQREFTVELSYGRRKEESEEEFVRRIEKETENLSPLLLIPDRAIRELVVEGTTPATLDALLKLRKLCGVSREVLIHRFKLFQSLDDNFRYEATPLSDVAFGRAEWKDSAHAVFVEWPHFENFRDSIIPAIFHSIRSQKEIPLGTATGYSESEIFAAPRNEVVCTVPAGTRNSPGRFEMEVAFQFEAVEPKKGKSFLYFLRKR